MLIEPTDSSTVVGSGSRINEVLMFRPGGPSTITVPSFLINDDNVGLESHEFYPIRFNTSFNRDINYGLNSRITIRDDDGKFLSFVT